MQSFSINRVLLGSIAVKVIAATIFMIVVPLLAQVGDDGRAVWSRHPKIAPSIGRERCGVTAFVLRIVCNCDVTKNICIGKAWTWLIGIVLTIGLSVSTLAADRQPEQEG